MTVPRPTIADIARRSGVSNGAVSFALNDKPGVSDETRRRILAVAEEMGWRPNSAARALVGARTGMAGLVSARPARTLGVEPFFAQLVSGLQAGLSQRGTGLQLLVVEDVDAEIEVYRRWASEHHVDGVVLTDLRANDPRVPELERLGLPCVVMGGPGRHGRLPSVWADDRAAMLRIVEYLAALGHRRIAHVAGLPDLWHTRRRRRALGDVARRLGLTARSLPTDYSDAEGAAATRGLLAAPERPTAIVYDNDVMAVAGLAVALEMGFSVPADVSLVSFDDSVLARMMHPSITSLSRDTFALGELLAESLSAVVERDGAVGSVQAETPRLAVRESTGVAPSSETV